MERKSLLRIGPRTQKDILKGKTIRKLDDGCDVFEDYWTDDDSDGGSSTLSKNSDLSSKLPNIESLNFSQTSSSRASRSGRKISHSPLKSKEVLCNVSTDIINADKIVNANKETSVTVFEDITVNLGIDDNNPEAVALNKHVDNLVRNNLHSELPKITSVAIPKTQDIDNSFLSQTHSKQDEVQVPVPKVKRSSQRSISRSTKIDAKVKELQLQYDECDEKIMQMVHMDYDENVESSIVSDDESSIQQSTSVEDKSSEVEKQTGKASKNIEDKENFFNKSQSYNESPNKSIKKNTKLLNQSLHDYLVAPVLNETENATKYRKDKIKSINYQTNANSMSPLKKQSSETFISKKTVTAKSSHAVYNSENSHEDSSHSDSDIFSELDNLEEQANKQTAATKSSVNTQIDSPININNRVNDSPTRITRKQKRNYLPIQDQSKTVMLEEASLSSSKYKKNERMKKEKNRNFCKNDAVCKSKADAEADISDNENIDNISGDALGDTSNLDDNALETYMIESQKAATNKKSNIILDENILDATDPSDSHQLQTAKKRKTLINKRHSSIPGKNYPANMSVNSLDNSEVDIKKMSKKQKVVENNISRQNTATNKTDYVPDEGIVETADSDDLFKLHTPKKQKTKNRSIQKSNSPTNIALNLSANSVNNTSKVNDEKTAKSQRKIKNKKNSQKTATNKSDYMSDEDIVETVDTNGLSQLQASKKRKTINNCTPESNISTNISPNSSVNSVDTASEVNDEKAAKNQRKIKNKNNRQKTATNKSDCMSNESILETVDTDDLQTSKKQKTRNSSVPESNSLTDISLNSSVNFVDNTSEVNDEKALKIQRKIENKNNRQKKVRNKSGYASDANIVKISDPTDFSQLQTSKKRKTRNNDVSEKNNLSKISLNSSENFIDNISEVHDKRNMKNRRKIEDNKSRQKTAAIKKSFHIVSNECTVETAQLGDLSPLQNSKRRKTKDDAPEQIDLANISLNSSEDNFVSISEVENKNTAEKRKIKTRRKIKNSKSRQETAKNEKSHSKTDKDIIGTENLSQLENSKKQKTKDDSILKENLTNTSLRLSRKSINSTSHVNIKKNTRKQSKAENNKSIHLYEKNDNENHNLSKTRAAGKSKSSVQKNNSDKTHEESNHASFPRRSGRQRYAPLAHWRNERLLYRFEDGNVETIGIDEGTQEDVVNLNALGKMVFIRNKKKERIVKPKKIKVLDVIEGKEKSVYLHKKFLLASWESHRRTDESNEFVYSIKRIIDTHKTSFGYIRIDVGKKKPAQFMPEEDLQLILLEGIVEITVYKQVYKLERKDMFIVPRGSAYSIANIGTKKAVLSYAVGNFKFLSNS